MDFLFNYLQHNSPRDDVSHRSSVCPVIYNPTRRNEALHYSPCLCLQLQKISANTQRKAPSSTLLTRPTRTPTLTEKFVVFVLANLQPHNCLTDSSLWRYRSVPQGPYALQCTNRPHIAICPQKLAHSRAEAIAGGKETHSGYP